MTYVVALWEGELCRYMIWAAVPGRRCSTGTSSMAPSLGRTVLPSTSQPAASAFSGTVGMSSAANQTDIKSSVVFVKKSSYFLF